MHFDSQSLSLQTFQFIQLSAYTCKVLPIIKRQIILNAYYVRNALNESFLNCLDSLDRFYKNLLAKQIYFVMKNEIKLGFYIRKLLHQEKNFMCIYCHFNIVEHFL